MPAPVRAPRRASSRPTSGASRVREVERKVPLRSLAEGRALLAALPVTSRGAERSARVRDVYLDTADRDLWTAGYGLRLRTSAGGDGVLTLKATRRADADGLHATEERSVAWEGALTDARVLPAGALRRTVVDLVGARPLRPLARVVGRRTRRRLRVDAELVVETSLDRVVLSCAGRRAPLLEAEVELVDGAEPAFRGWLERAWLGRARAAGPGKLERALALAGIRAPTRARVAAARLAREAVDASTPAARAGARDLARATAELERASASARRGSAEGVHDVRTLSRRIRAITRVHGGALEAAPLRDAHARLRALRRSCGPARDADVLEEALRDVELPVSARRGRDALVDVVRARRLEARRTLARALESPRLAGLGDAWARVVDELVGTASLPFGIVASLRLPGVLEPLLTARAAAGPALRDATPTRLHALRIAAKRARLALEACAPALGRPARRAARRLGDLADAAGALRDAEAQGAAVRSLLAAVPTLGGERREAEAAAARLGDAFETRAARARATLDRRFDEAAGPRALRALLAHLAKRAAAS